MPLVLSQAEFKKLVSWTDGSRENQDKARQAEYVKRLNEQSSHMTREWPNSFENVNKRNEEMRRARQEAAEQANTKFYKKYMRDKRDEQARLMYSARDTMFKNKDAPKMFLRAVIETCVQKERQEQLKFKGDRMREESEQKKKDDDDIIRHAAEWHGLMKTRRQRRFEADKQHQKEILEQAHEVAERNRTEHETELKYQILDNIKANEQMEALSEFERNFAKAEKARILADMNQAKAELEARRAEERARDQLDDKLIAVLQRSRARTQALRAKTERETREEQLRVLEMNSKRLQSGAHARDEKEQANLNAAIKEKEAIAEARRRSDREKEARIRRERDQVQEQFLAEQARRLHELDTRRQWEMMNREKEARIRRERDQVQEQFLAEQARRLHELDTRRQWEMMNREKEARIRRERDQVQEQFLAEQARRLHELDTRRQWEMMNREKEARIRRERDQVQEQFLAEQARRLHELDTRRQWDMMNRFKNQELYDDYQEKLRQEKARKIKEFREDTLRLWKERDERDARERAETRYFYGELAERKLRDADNRLFAHAQELLAEARRHGRPDYALRKALDRYCTMYRLYPMPELSATVQSHFPGYRPKDCCVPDPGYRPAPPPQPEPDDEAPPPGAPAAPAGHRSGLQPVQSVDKAGPSAPETLPEETVAEYKRIGRANGLQRTPAEIDIFQLPPISVVPCKTPNCGCPLKK